tara:strand:+ start:10648 stop:10830 length:183 start_codon:yes stop_codon:yes gene_type:complete
MKVKLKKGEKLSSMNNYCGLDIDSWTALNQDKVVELEVVPELIKEQVEEVKTASSTKGGK